MLTIWPATGAERLGLMSVYALPLRQVLSLLVVHTASASEPLLPMRIVHMDDCSSQQSERPFTVIAATLTD